MVYRFIFIVVLLLAAACTTGPEGLTCNPFEEMGERSTGIFITYPDIVEAFVKGADGNGIEPSMIEYTTDNGIQYVVNVFSEKVIAAGDYTVDVYDKDITLASYPITVVEGTSVLLTITCQ